ncbi:MAG: NADPH-dependent F420 reductase [Candidatus Nitrosocosmicus sp.]
MKIGILGSGEVGRMLGDGLIHLGYDIKIGSRNPQKEEVVQWINSHGDESKRAHSGTFMDAARFGDFVIIATSWAGTLNAIEMAGKNNFDGKIVMDVTNPLDFSKGMPPKLATGFSDSAGEIIQRMLPASRVVKAFNTVGNRFFINPSFPIGESPTMFICGNDDEAKKFVTDKIITTNGWEAIDVGGIEESRLLEPLALLWITLYFKTGSPNHAFKLLRK